MRELTDQERSAVGGAMHSISGFSLQHQMEPNQSSTFTLATPFGDTYKNTGTGLSCAALGAGAGPIIGTAAALGAVAATKNPASALPAYSRGMAWGGALTSAGCGYLQNQQFNH